MNIRALDIVGRILPIYLAGCGLTAPEAPKLKESLQSSQLEESEGDSTDPEANQQPASSQGKEEQQNPNDQPDEEESPVHTEVVSSIPSQSGAGDQQQNGSATLGSSFEEPFLIGTAQTTSASEKEFTKSLTGVHGHFKHFYKYTIPSGTTGSVRLVLDNFDGNLDMHIYDQNKVLQDSARNAGNFREEVMISGAIADDRYLEIVQMDGIETFYRLIVQFNNHLAP